MKLPLLISVPHAGWRVPEEVKPECVLTRQQILEDGDEGASEIYDISSEVEAFVTTDVARAIVDMNRAVDDRRSDGVVKTHTCWNVPVYRSFPTEDVIRRLLDLHYHPYHAQLSAQARRARLGIDCHTMAAVGPPVGPDPGATRPGVCLSNGDGTCPEDWLRSLASCLEDALEVSVSLNQPFRGGYIVRTHAAELPWVQLEMSRAPFSGNQEKRGGVIAALQDWVQKTL